MPLLPSGLVPFVLKNPTHSVPIHPPTKCTPPTSSESSRPSLVFRLTANAHTKPAMKPTKIEPIGLTQPAHGVIATRPATAPEAAPSAVGFPYRSFSASTQPSKAVAVAVFV